MSDHKRDQFFISSFFDCLAKAEDSDPKVPWGARNTGPFAKQVQKARTYLL